VCVCLVCGLLTTCILAFLLYSYLLSSSGEANIEHQENNVVQKREKSSGEDEVKHAQSKIKQKKKMSTLTESDAEAVPDSVLSKMKDVTVLEKTATFTVDERVSFMPNSC